MVVAQCRNLRRPCAGSKQTGFGGVIASADGEGGGRSLLISVSQRHTRRLWRSNIRDGCPQGRIDRPVKKLSGGRFIAGERGTGRRLSYRLGTWTGFVCTRDIEYRWPDDYDPSPEDEADNGSALVLLNNGHHSFFVRADTAPVATLVARQYLARLRGEK